MTLASLLLPAADADAWWNAAWKRRRKLTFDNSGQPSNLTSFPVLVVLTSPGRIDYTKTQNNGEDLRFVDANDNTVLSHEIEMWNESGTSYVWVKIPQIDGGSTTDFIWIYYDNPTAPAPPLASQQATWDSDFMMVQHLNEPCPPSCTGGAHTDSTVNGNNSSAITVTTQGTAAGRIDGADQFVLGDFIRVPDIPSLDVGLGESVLVEAWVQPADIVNWKHIVSKEWDGVTAGEGGLEFSMPDSRVRFSVNNGATVCDAFSGGGTIAAGSVYYIVGRYDRGTNNCEVFLNGSSVVSATNAVGTLANSQPLGIGREEDGTPGFSFNGVIDEVRLSTWMGATTRRSNDWIRAQWESMRSGSTFISYGPQSGQVTLRSIGTALPYTSPGSVNATIGSAVVSGSGGTTWLAPSNRGRGDRITIDGNTYTVLSVDANDQLTLTSPAVASYSGTNYSIERKFATLQDWEACIDGPPFGAGICEGPPTASLVADDRTEIGIAYEDSVYPPTALTIDGSTTDADHTITLTADGVNRHYGLPGTGVLIDDTAGTTAINVRDDYVTVEWLEILGGGNDGIQVDAVTAGANEIVLRNLLIHGVTGSDAVELRSADTVADVYNTIIYGSRLGISISATLLSGSSRIRLFNNTIYNSTLNGIWADATNTHPTVLIRNNISVGNGSPDYFVNTPSGACSNNLSEDGTHPGAAGLTRTVAQVQFVNAGAGDLHILATSPATDAGTNLSSFFIHDIDGRLRPGTWDMGADDTTAATAVKLSSFAARGLDRAVELTWATASELDNLGFHLYRSPSEDGPWTRLTSALIPGLGSSALGKAYSFRDSGLTNGTRYYYRLEDVDASSKTTSHGPLSAVPSAEARDGEDRAGADGDEQKGDAASSCPAWVLAAHGGSGGSAAAGSLRCTRHGDPEAVSLHELSRDSRSATLELRTGGFYALHEGAGTVRVFVPGFEFREDEEVAALPVRRALAKAAVGRKVELGGVRAMEVVGFRGLQPSALGRVEMEVGWDGTVRAGRREVRREARGTHVRRRASRMPQDELVRLLPSQFQGEKKSAVVEISPLRYDERRHELALSKRVRLRLLFTGREAGESGRGSLGRAPGNRKPAVTGEVLARLYTTRLGLHAVSFEELFADGRRGVPVSGLRLERQGEAVGFHVEPMTGSFGPGSRLYFYASETTGSTEYASELAYELLSSREGVEMPLVPAAPGTGALASAASVVRAFETNRFYQPGLLEAEDVWLWEALASGATRVQSFSLPGVDASGSAALQVFLQGASESGNPVDHHVSVSLNGVLLGEALFAGKRPNRVSLSVPASLLREDANELRLTNLADTGVSSLVFLDRYQVTHAQVASLTAGVFDGTWAESGTATLTGVTGPAALVDVTGEPRWLTGWLATAGALRFQAEADRRYQAVSQEALHSPRVARPQPSTLRSVGNQADYILIATEAFLSAAEPLVERRRDQGLAARAFSFEEIAAEFGHGQASAEAIRGFLGYAYQSWSRPSPRYVLLLGDASYDPRNFTGSAQPAPLPALWTKTSYLWTVSDPLLAAVNGQDGLPDLAIGRLPATTPQQAETLVQKLIAWEDSGQGLSGRATLVADNPDLAGDFEADVEDIRRSFLAGRDTRVLKLSELGSATRTSILDALNSGSSYLNYVGHGGAAVWASENVWNSWDAASLQAQSEQPLLVTMNCLNGYFVAPAFDSLSESLLKAEGRGAVASFSPSGLSLDGPAHQYHRALMAALTSGQHPRLGDAVLAAQQTYAESGLMPELLSVYHLLGDAATPIR